MKTYIKTFDIIIILLVIILTVFAAYIVYMKPKVRSQILIRGQDGEWTYPVDAEETVKVYGPLGETVVRLHGNSAWIESSPCESQTCVAAGQISRQGQWTACLPNNVLLMVQGAGDDSVDSIVW
ncbi:MAG: NusG domain II-containing protein [Treponema sp.]|nr:NusG domain II-containing protein [Treponema sp.]